MLERRLLLLGDAELKQTCMNVVHNFKEVETEADVNRRAIYKLVKCVIIKLLNEVAQEDLILMHRTIVA